VSPQAPIRIAIADDERPARAFLAAILADFGDVRLVGEAQNGPEAIQLIEREHPDLALLDLQMPEIDGLGVVRLLNKKLMPLIAFVTAHDEYAVRAFELNAVDYLLKPVERARLRETINRVRERLEHEDWRSGQARHLEAAAADYEGAVSSSYLERIPVRRRDEFIIVPVQEIAAVTAEAELLHISTVQNQTFTITYRLKDLETRLDPRQFVRLGRGTLANLSMLRRLHLMPGGTCVATLANGLRLNVSRQHARILREQMLKL
jgi:two-component system LytT family response regulator